MSIFMGRRWARSRPKAPPFDSLREVRREKRPPASQAVNELRFPGGRTGSSFRLEAGEEGDEDRLGLGLLLPRAPSEDPSLGRCRASTNSKVCGSKIDMAPDVFRSSCTRTGISVMVMLELKGGGGVTLAPRDGSSLLLRQALHRPPIVYNVVLLLVHTSKQDNIHRGRCGLARVG